MQAEYDLFIWIISLVFPVVFVFVLNDFLNDRKKKK